jgi:hypothetical protein
MKQIGSTFSAELKAAGLSCLPFSWGTDGAIQFGDTMTQAQKDAVQAVYDAHDPTATVVPTSVSPFQARKALRHQGMLAQVQTAIAVADEDMQDAWEYATSFDRNSPFVLGMTQGLGWTDEMVDNLFILAASL